MNQEEYNFLMFKHSSRSAFTLIELLVVIAIIAILAVVVVITLNPAQLLAQSRDANRVSDMATLNSAINLYSVDQAGTGSFSLGTSSVTYVSIPDPTATTTAGKTARDSEVISLPVPRSLIAAPARPIALRMVRDGFPSTFPR